MPQTTLILASFSKCLSNMTFMCLQQWCSLTQMRKTCFELTSEYFMSQFSWIKMSIFSLIFATLFRHLKDNIHLFKESCFQLSTKLVKCYNLVRNLSNVINCNRTFLAKWHPFKNLMSQGCIDGNRSTSILNVFKTLLQSRRFS